MTVSSVADDGLSLGTVDYDGEGVGDEAVVWMLTVLAIPTGLPSLKVWVRSFHNVGGDNAGHYPLLGTPDSCITHAGTKAL